MSKDDVDGPEEQGAPNPDEHAQTSSGPDGPDGRDLEARDPEARDQAALDQDLVEPDAAQDHVRNLLAAAGEPADEQIPDHVAARLDDVLAGLVSERAKAPVTSAPGSPPPVAGAAAPSAPGDVQETSARSGSDVVRGQATVSDLASRRRRRWFQGLAAAAAVSVVGVGIGTVLGDTGSGSASLGSNAVTAESAGGAAADSAGGADEGAAPGPEVAPRSQPARPDDSILLTEHPLRLRTSSLTVDVQRIEDFSLAAPVAGTRRALGQACVQPRTGTGDEWLPVRLDGQPGVLVLRAPADGRRTAEVYTCDEPDDPAAEVTVDAR
jgi:hypothetical protein